MALALMVAWAPAIGEVSAREPVPESATGGEAESAVVPMWLAAE